jgi:hypothetical protein
VVIPDLPVHPVVHQIQERQDIQDIPVLQEPQQIQEQQGYLAQQGQPDTLDIQVIQE